MSLEEGIKHSTSARDASRLDERLRRIIKFSLANHVSVRTATWEKKEAARESGARYALGPLLLLEVACYSECSGIIL